MSQININSAIKFIGKFYSELPPQTLAIIISLITLGLYIVSGIVVAAILGFLALFITNNGIAVLSLCALIVAVFSIYGLIKAILNYKSIILSYENHKP